MASSVGIALDIGTSGLRAQAIDLSSSSVLATAVTTRHPLPGANVIDHLHFALEMGVETAGEGMAEAVNQLVASLPIQACEIERLAVCGNPTQLSLFQSSEIRDLAYAGERKLVELGVTSPTREAAVLAARDLPGLRLAPHCEVIIPPAVRHEIGADALALLIQTGMLEKDENALATDYGTNAEIALVHRGQVFTGSTAAGPALEGQQIACGMLAMPGAIADLEAEPPYFRLAILDAEMHPGGGPLVDLRDGRIVMGSRVRPTGITGTGTIAILSQALEAGLVVLPNIHTPDGRLHFGEEIWFGKEDLFEAGKAIGAVRAGHIALCHEAGIGLDEIPTAYMAGASGTYVDTVKAQRLGLVPPRVKTIYQVGNTSLAMARDLVKDPRKLDQMSALAERLRQSHCMFATSKAFGQAYLLELSFWGEGMPISMYRKFLKRYGLPALPEIDGMPNVARLVERDIPDLGQMGLTIVTDIGRRSHASFDGCIACMDCVTACPENALSLASDETPTRFGLYHSLCAGMACRRCERSCPERIFDLRRFFCP
ncbi:MAG: methylamine methyltransferase corrinoid protein reductive activase [Chloroflexota bacterium]